MPGPEETSEHPKIETDPDERVNLWPERDKNNLTKVDISDYFTAIKREEEDPRKIEAIDVIANTIRFPANAGKSIRDVLTELRERTMSNTAIGEETRGVRLGVIDALAATSPEEVTEASAQYRFDNRALTMVELDTYLSLLVDQEAAKEDGGDPTYTEAAKALGQVAMSDKYTDYKRPSQVLQDVQERYDAGVFKGGLSSKVHEQLGVLIGDVSKMPPIDVRENVEEYVKGTRAEAAAEQQAAAAEAARRKIEGQPD